MCNPWTLHQALIWDPINRTITPGGSSLDPLKLIILIILGALWVHQTLGDMLNIIVSNSHFGKRPTAREMTTFVSHVGAQYISLLMEFS